MAFKDIPKARKFMKLYALANKKVLKLKKSGKRKVRYRCIVGCPFLCLISKDGNARVTVKTLESEHNCGIAYDNSIIDFNTIAHYFKEKLQDNPKYKVREMVLDLKRIFELNVSHGKCKRSKRMILETLDRCFAYEYNKLDSYAIELRESNSGSDVVINISKDALENGKRRFLRMYVCFKSMKMRFKLGLRPFIGVDGTFLKGKAKGQLLVVVGQDAQNHFYHLAWAVVDKERKHSWNWFLQLLQGSLDLKEGEGITFISDMQKSWCKASLDTVCKNQSVDNNFTELFNSWILEVGQKPIIKMLEDIRLKVMYIMTKHEAEASTWSNEYGPNSLELYNEFMEIAQVCKVHSNGEGGYEDSEGSDKNCINLSIKKCTYKEWDLTGIPCPHAIRALHNKGDPLTEMHRRYSKEAFLLSYRHKLQPVRGEHFWKIDPSQAMEPPELVKLAGRPKVKRDRQKDEAVKRQRQSNGKQLRKGKQPVKRTRTLLDSET
ncbi:uncharacterized protein [Nicotiana sylvestris]|uniref:uncharacterized protein n=1 Tax=Nicotiana sylvestris TaxID=4096 RepID=UPI00388C687B